MRKILFRGKRVDNGEFVFGYYVHYDDIQDKGEDDCDYIVEKHNGENFPFIKVTPETVGQYTGLKDKNGTMIFEGDILKIIDNYNNGVIWSVSYKPSAFVINQTDINYSTYLGSCNNGKFEIEVIGNIYDNPELLEGK